MTSNFRSLICQNGQMLKFQQLFSKILPIFKAKHTSVKKKNSDKKKKKKDFWRKKLASLTLVLNTSKGLPLQCTSLLWPLGFLFTNLLILPSQNMRIFPNVQCLLFVSIRNLFFYMYSTEHCFIYVIEHILVTGQSKFVCMLSLIPNHCKSGLMWWL